MREIFADIKGFLFDMDGVWFVQDTPIPGAADALRAIKAKGYPCRFITNTTTKSLDSLHAQMQAMRLPIERDEIISASQAAVIYLTGKGLPSVYPVVADDVAPALERFPYSETDPEYVVVGDIGDRWNYALLNKVFRMIIGGSQLIAMHRGKYWQVEDGLSLDIGAFVVGLEYATGQDAILVGKPAAMVFESALADAGLKPNEAVMIGDDIASDVGGAQQVGIKGVLVKTGKYRADLVARSLITPDAVIDSVADLPGLL